ncbi:MAG: hypothetical protein CVU63_15260 [Deltaproteobacteria bacterium HGW-Deltaproteobacteria-20]|jgi:hypothetical protein|nr:MAG: hypothetical protein CVU63_15260 [Deltaproteobacteria bacterium HGW-Deltaproteobacteria-20]
MDSSDDDVLDVLWRNVLEDWDNPKAHDGFLQMAWERGELGSAAGKYRAALEDPARQELAQAKMKAAALLAMQEMEGSKSSPHSAPRWILWVAGALCAAALGLLAWALVR